MSGFAYLSSTKDVVSERIVRWQNSTGIRPEGDVRMEVLGQRRFWGFKKHEGYPIFASEVDRFWVVLEGVCYNMDEAEFLQRVVEVGELFEADQDFRGALSKLQREADADFAALIVSKSKSRTLCFNDSLAKLPVYWGSGLDGVSVSRELRSCAFLAGITEIDQEALADTLANGFPLGIKTVFSGVEVLEPGSFVSIVEDRVTVGETLPLEFGLTEPFSSRTEAISVLARLAVEATSRRVETCRTQGKQILCDLSGGFDSRAILGLVAKATQDAEYLTYQYVQDESKEASQAFRDLGSPGRHTRLSFDSTLEEGGLPNLLLRTDGLVNYYTTAVCYRESEHIFGTYGPSSWRFGGFGGEFIRHPFLKFRGSYVDARSPFLYAACGPDLAAKLAGLDSSTYQASLRKSWRCSTGREREVAVKRYYHNYYLRYVGYGGDERERSLNWSIHPLWSFELLTTIYRRVPLRWITFGFFAEFIRAIDDRLMSAPIYGKGQILGSRTRLWLQQKEYELKTHTSWLRRPWALKMVRSLVAPQSDVDVLLSRYGEVSGNSDDTAQDQAEATLRVPDATKKRVLTFLLFAQEFSLRYGLPLKYTLRRNLWPKF